MTDHTNGVNRRSFIKSATAVTVCSMLPVSMASAKTFLTVDQAKEMLLGKAALTKVEVTLTEQQAETIEDATDVRVRHNELKVWKTADNNWFILDQVIGKHENIDLAVALTHEGKVIGLEVLTYRESYGDQVRIPKWREQFHGKDHTTVLELDEEIVNIAGATLSCSHITDGINRLTHTWKVALAPLQA